MKHGFRMLPVALGAALLFVAPSHARNHDCSKAGNANKAVCKGAAAAATAGRRSSEKVGDRDHSASL